MQSSGKRITNCSQDSLIRLCMAVELVRRAEESICLVQTYSRECQPVAAVCGRDRGGGDAMMGKPGVDEFESVRMWRDQLSNFLL
jgi:hypothetical protein